MASPNRFATLAIFVVAAILAYLTYQMLQPFLSAIIWAIVLSIVFYPVYLLIRKGVKLKSVASLLCLFLILIILLGPFAYFSYILTQEIFNLSEYLRTAPSDPVTSLLEHPMVNKGITKMLKIFHMTEGEFTKAVADNLQEMGKQSMGIIRSGLGNAVTTLVNFVFMLLSIFFFLADGPELLERISTFMPFSKRQRERLLKQTRDIVVSTIYGGVTIAVIQGLMGGIAFSILGVSSPVMWGLAMCISSFIPLVGTFVIWGPAVAYLALQGFYWKALVLFIVGAMGISSVDSFLRPLIIKGRLKLPTLAIFFSILGGIKVFGFVGFILGPLVFALFISVLEILRYTDEDATKEHAE
ncbi:MAG TPA: AI-2E family transporter [Syntrophorhabdaceae bacterium]|jgi:predicted PurR-regulated permease PerM